MPGSSRARRQWQSERANALDQLVSAHAALGGKGPGRRYATEQVVHAYAVLLSSHFQGFCRDLHSEVSDHIANATTPAGAPELLRQLLTANRKLDSGNPNPGNIGSDFGRFGFTWKLVEARDNRTGERQRKLKLLNDWRNAIAHQDIDPTNPDLNLAQRPDQKRTSTKARRPRYSLRIADVDGWRIACSALTKSFEAVCAERVKEFTGRAPW